MLVFFFFFNIVIIISYAFSLVVNKSLHVGSSDPLFHSCYDVSCTVHFSSARTNGVQKMPNLDYTVAAAEQSSPDWQCAPLPSKEVCGLALLCCKRKALIFSGLTLI